MLQTDDARWLWLPSRRAQLNLSLDKLGRHGNRPSHVHYFISAPGYRKLTTQFNIEGDKYLWDDFAFATREGLVATAVDITDEAEIARPWFNRSIQTHSIQC